MSKVSKTESAPTEALGDATIARHSGNGYDSPILYTSWFCPYAQRAWIGLEVKGVPYKYVEIYPYRTGPNGETTKTPKPLEEKARDNPDFVRASPRGLVPGLNNNGETSYESMVVLEYIDEVFPGPKLLPSSPGLRGKARALASFCNEKIMSTFYRLLNAQDPSAQKPLEDALLQSFEDLAQWLDPEGPFLLGKEFGYLDITLIPWWQRLAVLKEYRGFEIPNTGKFARYHKWYDACLKVDAYRNTIIDTDRVLKSYQSYADNSATSTVAKQARV